MVELNTVLVEELRKNGFVVKTASVDHIKELEDEITSLKRRGALDGQFYAENLHWLDFDYTNTVPAAKSILVLACPQFKSRLIFEHAGQKHAAVIPPTYVYSELTSRVENILGRVLAPRNYAFKKTKLPAKLLAVRTGLSTYGRNNISYIDGMGSFYRLFSFYTDMPCVEDNWQEKVSMPECSKCSVCIRACPTGSISSGRFLIQADMCITNFNEKEKDFPLWFNQDWPNAIVGCMKCQMVCPKNKDYIDEIESEVAFDAEETGMILNKVPLSQLPNGLKSKLDRLDLTEYYEVIPRNMLALIQSHKE